MHRSRTWWIALTAMVLLMAGCGARPFPPPDVESFVHSTEPPPLGAAADGYPQAQVRIASSDGFDHVLAVRMATSPDQLSAGLEGVDELPTGTGLLLVFPEEEHSGGITTDGVEVVLDMAFIDQSGEIISVFTGNPCRSTPCTVYDPERTFRAVLQVPVGWLRQHELGSGDTVSWDILGS